MSAAVGLAALVIDRVVGEPPVRWHPVAWFGTTMNAFEARWYADSRHRGIAYTTTGVALGLASGRLLERGLGKRLASVVAASIAIAGTMLETEAHGVAEALRLDDLDEARVRVGGLVGRQTSDLSAPEVSRAVIETLGENTVDAVTASLFCVAAGGAPGVLAHRAINTMDAMVGHRNDRYARFGWASARLDDVVNWLPARLTAVAVMAASPSRASHVVRTIRRDASHHPSPNGGVVEAAFAAALDLRLGGTNRYGDVFDDRGVLGDGDEPSGVDIDRAAALARRSAAAFVMGVAGFEMACRAARRRCARSALPGRNHRRDAGAGTSRAAWAMRSRRSADRIGN